MNFLVCFLRGVTCLNILLQIEVEARHLKARNCADAIANFELRRRNRRMPLARRQTATSTSSAVAPHYSTIQNVCPYFLIH